MEEDAEMENIIVEYALLISPLALVLGIVIYSIYEVYKKK